MTESKSSCQHNTIKNDDDDQMLLQYDRISSDVLESKARWSSM